MGDLVKRLRAGGDPLSLGGDEVALCKEAADEIERLRELLGQALCELCGEQIGDEEAVCADSETLAHRRCVETM